jgi:signal transduction histidine kinase
VLAPRLDRVDLLQCARDVAERLRASAYDRNVRIEVLANGPTVALLDVDLVSRLVWNLLANAIAFSPAGGTVTVHVGTRNDVLVLSVSDQGPGIPEEALPRVFERFFQVDEARTPDGASHGTGLGLAIVRAIADLHKAEVRASHGPQGGAIFEVAFPTRATAPDH